MLFSFPGPKCNVSSPGIVKTQVDIIVVRAVPIVDISRFCAGGHEDGGIGCW